MKSDTLVPTVEQRPWLVAWRQYYGRLWRHKLFMIPSALFVLLSLLYLMAIPAGESPDEPGHLRCIEQVAVERRLPRIVQPQSDTIEWWRRENLLSDYMCYHMPAYYVTAGYMLRMVSSVTGEAMHYVFPDSTRFANDSPLFNHEPRHSIRQVSQPINLLLLRLFSIFAGLIVLVCTYVIAHHLFPGNQLTPLVAATIIAGWPQFVFIHRALSNDPAATALAAAVLAILVFVGKPRRFIAAAALASLALLTKLTTAFTLPVILVAWFVEFWLYPDRRRGYRQVLWFCLMIWAGLILLLWFEPTLRGNWQYVLNDVAGVRPSANLPAYWQQVYVWTLSSGWAWFGWLNVTVPALHAHLWWLAVQLAALFGVYAFLKKQASLASRAQLILLLVWCLAILLFYIRITATVWQPQFRFAFSVLPVLASFMAYGLLFRLEQRFQWIVWGLLLIGLFGYNLWVVFYRLIPVYG
jgi:hypothetical protein